MPQINASVLKPQVEFQGDYIRAKCLQAFSPNLCKILSDTLLSILSLKRSCVLVLDSLDAR